MQVSIGAKTKGLPFPILAKLKGGGEVRKFHPRMDLLQRLKAPEATRPGRLAPESEWMVTAGL